MFTYLRCGSAYISAGVSMLITDSPQYRAVCLILTADETDYSEVNLYYYS